MWPGVLLPFAVSPPPLVVEAKSLIKQEKTGDSGLTPSHRLRFPAPFRQAWPDTRQTRADKLIRGENFSDTPGELAVLTYSGEFPAPGRDYLWMRASSTGTVDNGIHAGFDGAWPESGKRLQWCEGKNAWTWARNSGQLRSGSMPSAGRHTVDFSLREDGFRFGRFL